MNSRPARSVSWESTRLRFVARLNPSKAEINLPGDVEVSFLPMEAIGEDGSLRLDTTRPIAEVQSGYSYFRDGDVTVAKITPCFENGKGALMRDLIGGVGFGTTELIVARPDTKQLDPAFLLRLFQSREFRALGEGSMYGAGGQKRVPDEFVRDFAFALPPLPQQTAIAAFLDRETAKIDGLVEEQRRLIDLLKEKRQAIISHAVTRGLDPNARMKHSGVEWLGDVPEHWEVLRLASLYQDAAEVGSMELPIFSVSIHTGVSDTELDDDEVDRKVTRSDDRSKYKRVRPGDLVYNMMRAWQGGFGSVEAEGMVSPAYVVARPTGQALSPYIEALLRTPTAVEEMRRRSRGVTDFRLRLYWEEFRDIRVPVPPRNEQLALLDALAAIDIRTTALVSGGTQLIALLKERRSALISAAVTGAIDTRDLARSSEEAA